MNRLAFVDEEPDNKHETVLRVENKRRQEIGYIYLKKFNKKEEYALFLEDGYVWYTADCLQEIVDKLKALNVRISDMEEGQS